MWLRLKAKINCCVISNLKVISWNWFCLFQLISLSRNEINFFSQRFFLFLPWNDDWNVQITTSTLRKKNKTISKRGNSKLIVKSLLEFHPWPFPHPHSVKSIWRRGGLWRDFGDSLTHFYPNLEFCKKSPENTDRTLFLKRYCYRESLGNFLRTKHFVRYQLSVVLQGLSVNGVSITASWPDAPV